MFNKQHIQKIKYITCLTGLLFAHTLPTLCHAEFKDPTEPHYPLKPSPITPPAALVTPPITPPIIEKNLILSAIWIKDSGKWATINDITAKEGETILDDIKILKITQNIVFLSYNGNIKKLQLLHFPNQTP
jgi:hypothetical protein